MTLIVQPRPPADDDPAAARESFVLVEQFRSGDRQAAATEIYRRYHPKVFKFVCFRVASRPLAEDIAQDVFVRALRRLHVVEWRGSDLGAWLFTIARNLVADYYKSGSYRLETLVEDGALRRDEADDELNPEAKVMAYLQGKDLLAGIMQLTGEQQDVLICRFFRGLSVRETAEEMGKNEGAVKAVQYRATRSLMSVLDKAGLLEDVYA